ncbi:hypothetical protein G3N96_19505 [Burkholderia sp. Se-20373]|uniref:hypothetical protein n=1 Tax=Burkholderia sp. Se-20373 TaxID=2703898 RepID=UPI00197D9EB8|nr:hypothetical protein [Burkholderia sp. Se-20373]MBN3747595.1 hypothetical protein [Burkholderia sp. Se-20373]
MIVGGAEHEIDFVTIRFPIRLQASFDRIHPALRQMASRRSRLDLKKHAEQADHDALRRLPGHPVMSIFSGSVLFASARRQNSIFFNDIQQLEIHHARTIPNVRQVTLTQITEPRFGYCLLPPPKQPDPIQLPRNLRISKSGNPELIR